MLECTGLAGAAASAHASHAAPQLQAVQQLNKSAQHTQDLLKYASVALIYFCALLLCLLSSVAEYLLHLYFCAYSPLLLTSHLEAQWFVLLFQADDGGRHGFSRAV